MAELGIEAVPEECLNGSMNFRLRPPALRVAAALLSLVALASLRAAAPDTTLWYQEPATNWHEALPIGNGRLGAMIFGGVAKERIQLNEDSLWSGAPQDADNPAAPAALPEIRQMLFAGRYAEAEKLARETLI